MIVILTLGITLIPSIMTWTSTGIKVSVDEFIDDTVYQLGIRSNDPTSALGYYRYLVAEEALINNPKVERVDRLVSSVGLVNGHLDPNITYSFNQDLFYTTLIVVVVFQLVLLLVSCVIPAKKAAKTEPAIKLRNL